jgi:hypothetical protein
MADSLALLSQWLTGSRKPRNRNRGARRRTWISEPGAVQSAFVHSQIEALEHRLLLAGAPVISAPATASTPENVPLVFSPAEKNPISLKDASAVEESDNLSLTVEQGTFTLANASALTFVNDTKNDSPIINAIGSLAALNAAVDGLVYQPMHGYIGSISLKLTLFNREDNQYGSATVAVTVAPAPTITVPLPSTALENGSLTFSQAENDPFTVKDHGESSDNIDTLKLNVSHGTLTLGPTTVCLSPEMVQLR